MRIFLICNPGSGTGPDIDATTADLERLGAEVLRSEEGAERVLVVGGDGSIGPGAEIAARLKLPLAAAVVDEYGGDAASLWSTASDGAELLHRLEELPGFGRQKAQIFVALLGKQLDVRPDGWREAAGPYGEEGSHRSVADVRDAASLARVRAYKQEQKKANKPSSGGSRRG